MLRVVASEDLGDPGDGASGDASDGAGEEVVGTRDGLDGGIGPAGHRRGRGVGAAVLVVLGGQEERGYVVRGDGSEIDRTGGATRTRPTRPTGDAAAPTTEPQE